MKSMTLEVSKRTMMKVAGGFLVSTALFMSTPLYADDMSDWRKGIVKKIVKSHIYPRSAISREIEGAAKIQITIDRTGKITSYDIIEASGQNVLDNTIPKMVGKMDPLPAPPDSLSDEGLTFVIPVSWRLQ